MEHNGVEEYHDCTINWDIGRIDGTQFWKGTAAIVSPPDASPGIPAVRSVPGIPARFDSEKEARQSLLRMARGFIDNGMPVQATKWQAQKTSHALGEQRWAERSNFMIAACAVAFLLGFMAASLRSQ